MMPLRLEMNAFGPYAGKQIIDFRELKDRKLFLIYGPTGAGKTTVLDAMCYALYGDTSGDVRTGAHMRSEYASPQEKTYVSFSFAIGTKKYCVERNPEQEIAKKRGTGLKKEAAKAGLYSLNDDDTKKDVLATKNVNGEIIRLLGFKSDQFRQVVLLPQGDFRKLLLATSSDRQQIMQTLFHTQRYAKLQSLAKEEYDHIQQSYSQTQSALGQQLQIAGVDTEEALTEALAQAQEKQQQAQTALQQANSQRDAYQQTVQDAQALYSHWQSLKQSQAKATALGEQKQAMAQKEAYIELLEKAKVLAEPCRHLDEIQDKGIAASTEAKGAQQRIKSAMADVKALQDEWKKLEEQKDAYQEKGQRLVQLQGLVPKVEAYKRLCKDLIQADRMVQDAEKKWHDMTAKIKQLRKERDEKQPVSTAYASLVQALEQAKHQYTTYQERLGQEEQLAALDKDLQALRHERERAEKRFHQAAETARARRLAYESMEAVFFQGQAALLASELQDGQPCPVCGATTHPHLAVCADEMPQKADVDTAKEAAEQSERQRQQAQVEWTSWQTKESSQAGHYQSLRQQYPDEGTVEVWQERLTKQQAEVQRLTGQVKATKAAQERLTALDQELRIVEQQEQTLRNEYEQTKLTAEKIRTAKEQAEADIPEPYRLAQTLSLDIRSLTKAIEAYEKAVETMRQQVQSKETELARWQEQAALWQGQVEQLRKDYQDGVAALRERVLAAGFSSVKDCRKAQQDVPKIDAVQAEVTAYTQAVQQVQGQIAQEQAYIGTKEEPQMARYQDQLKQYNDQCRILSEQQATYLSQVRQLQQVTTQIAAIHEQQEALTEQYKAVGSLYELISGKVTGINFERYVLGALLDDVLQAANYRLDEMSRHRYELQRSQSWDDKRVKQIGLDIEVFDNYTGYARPANTLSGGETFLASLALALGLADVVQSYSGGIHLDTMFIDEGFGTLDGETLDFALKALLELKQGGRLVGIISHVPELQERIDTRLAVRKTERGSTASFELL